MSATFACPHCGATYPVKPVLIGKAVRCTKCKNAFMLRPDGVADAVAGAVAGTATVGASAQPPPVEPRPTVAATPAKPPRPAEPAPVEPRPTAAVVPAEKDKKPAPATPATPKSDTEAIRVAEARLKLNQKQEEARRAMAGTLASAAAAALKAEAVKREEEKAKKGPSAPAGAGGKPGGSSSQRLGPVLVVGEGEREARNSRTWLLGVLALVALVVVILALVAMRSPQRRALDAFAAPVEGRFARYPSRLPEMQARAWLSNGPALIELGSVSMGATARYDLAAAKAVVTALAKDQVYLQQYDFWLPSDQAGRIAKLWNQKKDRDANLQALREAGLAITTRAELLAKLGKPTEAGGKGGTLPPDGVAVLMQLLLPTQGSPQGAAQRLAKGELPDAIEVAPFTGRHGTALQDAGSKYAFPETDYSGKLLRFVGEGWPMEWRVVEVRFSR